MTAESGEYALEPRLEPRHRQKLVPDGVLGVLLVIFAEIMFFAGLISAHAVARSQVAGQLWPPYGHPVESAQGTAS